MKTCIQVFWKPRNTENAVTKSSEVGKPVENRYQNRGQFRFWPASLGNEKNMFEFKFFRVVIGSFLLATSVCTYSGTFWKADPVRENGLFLVILYIYRNFPSKLPKSSLTSILVSDFHRLPDFGGLCNRVFRVPRLSKNLYTNFHTKCPNKSYTKIEKWMTIRPRNGLFMMLIRKLTFKKM